MSYTEKIDVLDLLIEILSEHERTLDECCCRLEESVNVLNPRDNPNSPGP